MDISEAFDCVPHDLLHAKFAAYGVVKSVLCYIYTYLLNRKQCVQINNINGDSVTVVSGVPQGSIVGPILFNCFFNNFSYVKVSNLMYLLESESSVAIKWFKDNKMIVNPGRFQAIILDKKKNNHSKK